MYYRRSRQLEGVNIHTELKFRQLSISTSQLHRDADFGAKKDFHTWSDFRTSNLLCKLQWMCLVWGVGMWVCASIHGCQYTWMCVEARGQCWCLPQLFFSLLLLFFLSRIVISLNSEINNSNTLADQDTLGILLSPPSKGMDYQHIPPCLAFSISSGDSDSGPHMKHFTDLAISLVPKAWIFKIDQRICCSWRSLTLGMLPSYKFTGPSARSTYLSASSLWL